MKQKLHSFVVSDSEKIIQFIVTKNQIYLALQNCEVLTTRTYDYTKFYKINEINIQNKNNASDDFYANFKVYVIGRRDAHILLSQSPTDTRSSYEIVVGTLLNSQVEIRRHTSVTNRIFSLSTPNILQRDEPNEIQIKVTKCK